MSLTIFRMMSIPRPLPLIAVLVAVLFSVGCNGQGNGYRAGVGVGDPAPKSYNLTVEDPDRWYEVSTMDTKLPLYRWSIADLIENNKPFLVVFGTPQHCTMCVDQLVRIAVMEEMYGDRFAFIHIDGYKDTKVLVEWGVKGEPWTFFVDAKGIVSKVFPGQTEIALLEMEMLALLKVSG